MIIEREVGKREGLCLRGDALPGMETIPETLLIDTPSCVRCREAGIPGTKLDIGDVGIETLLFTEGEVGTGEIIAVCCEGFAFEIVGAFANLDHIFLSPHDHRG